MIYVITAPIILFSKKQNTVESSTFGSEFLDMRIARYLIVAIHYKLRSFGVPLDRTSDMMWGNQGLVNNTGRTQYDWGNKHNIVNCHFVREAAAARILRVGKEDTYTNLADLMTNILG